DLFAGAGRAHWRESGSGHGGHPAERGATSPSARSGERSARRDRSAAQSQPGTGIARVEMGSLQNRAWQQGSAGERNTFFPSTCCQIMRALLLLKRTLEEFCESMRSNRKLKGHYHLTPGVVRFPDHHGPVAPTS